MGDDSGDLEDTLQHQRDPSVTDVTYVALLLLDWTVRGPWRDPQSFGFPLTPMYGDAALIGRIELPGIGRLDSCIGA